MYMLCTKILKIKPFQYIEVVMTWLCPPISNVLTLLLNWILYLMSRLEPQSDCTFFSPCDIKYSAVSYDKPASIVYVCLTFQLLSS